MSNAKSVFLSIASIFGRNVALVNTKMNKPFKNITFLLLLIYFFLNSVCLLVILNGLKPKHSNTLKKNNKWNPS